MNNTQKLLVAFVAWLSFAGVSSAALVAQWELQDNAATATIVATVGTDGGLSGDNSSSLTGTPGPGTVLTRYLAFNGVDDIVVASSGNGGIIRNKAFVTVACWFQTTTGDTTGIHTLMIATRNVGGNSRAGLFLDTNGQLLCYARAGDGESAQIKTSTSSYDDGSWHHAAAVIDYAGDTITLYVDGVSVAQSGSVAFTATATSDTDSANVYLASGVGTERLKGKLADCRFYDSDESANIGTIMAEAGLGSSPVAKILLQLSDARLRKQSKHFDTYGVYALTP